jgi:hypothetical protein
MSFQNFELPLLMQHKFEIEVRVFRRRLPAFPCVGGSRHHLKGKKLLSMTRGVLCSLALVLATGMCDALILGPVALHLAPTRHFAPSLGIGMVAHTTDECLADLGERADKDTITECLAPVYGTPAEEECIPDEECQPSYVNQRLVGWAKASSSKRPKSFSFPSMNFVARAFRGLRRHGAAHA